jgi:hypothetical protein
LQRVYAEHLPSPGSIEDQLAALLGHNVELWKENQSLQSRIRTLEVRLATAEDTLINLSPQNLGMQTHKSFAFFPKLPLEIRRMIWIFARPVPRVLKIFEKWEGVQKVVYSTAKVPALLHACQESRWIAKEWYKLSFPGDYFEPQSSRIYFDCSSDYIYVPQEFGEDKGNPTHSNINPYLIRYMMTSKVMSVIHEVPEIWEIFYLLAHYFPSATKALLVLETEGMLQGSAELSEFTLTADPFTWQETRTLQKTYIDASEKPRYDYLAGNWNLTSIQRARFAAVGREG